MFRSGLAIVVIALFAFTASAEDKIFSTGDGAIRGYDPVAYFEQGRPVRGQDDVSLEWNGATWHFANARNRDAFERDPERYAPKYGGYCAWAVANGYTASISPHAWDIVDGKLYLNYSRSVRRNWRKDIPGNIAKADQNWPQVLTP